MLARVNHPGFPGDYTLGRLSVPYRTRLRSLAQSVGVEGDLGFVDFDENPYRYMRRVWLLALSPRSEGLPTVILEALACGTPVVSTDAPCGPREILGDWGDLPQVSDVAALAATLRARAPTFPLRRSPTPMSRCSKSWHGVRAVEAITPEEPDRPLGPHTASGQNAAIVFDTGVGTVVFGLAIQSLLAYTPLPEGRSSFALCAVFASVLGVLFTPAAREGARSPNYTPTDQDGGKFVRAWVSYEKSGRTHRVQTKAIGPILTTSAATATDADAPLHLLKAPGETVESFRGKDDSNYSSRRSLSRRMLLWEMGFNKVLESPIAGHGLYQLHYMEGTPVGHHGRPTGVHNVYLMLSGEAGMIPLALYLLSLFFLMRLLWAVSKSLGRDSVVGWIIVMALYGLSFHHLLTMGASNFAIGRRPAPRRRSSFRGKETQLRRE